jgi:hypothetical protein
MGVLSYLVIANFKDANHVRRNFLSKKFTWIDNPGFDPNDFVNLLSLLTKKRVSKTLAARITLICGESNGPWVYSIDQELVTLLSKLAGSAIPDIVERWCERDSWLQQVAHQDVEARLRLFRKVSEQSIREKKSLLLWISL